jgi:hypothetical protein
MLICRPEFSLTATRVIVNSTFGVEKSVIQSAFWRYFLLPASAGAKRGKQGGNYQQKRPAPDNNSFFQVGLRVFMH